MPVQLDDLEKAFALRKIDINNACGVYTEGAYDPVVRVVIV
jgi:hypothetical protein